jgi:GNAT superfamily N-acetyltransferase/chorismate mutase
VTHTDEVVLRPAVLEDAAAVADVHLASRRSAAMPPGVHTDDEVRSWLTARVAEDPVWVAEHEDRIVGYARFPDAWLDDLYVHPDHARQGIGSALLDLVKAERPDGFCLWVFEINDPARRFYRRHGLVELERTAGDSNEERAPDIRMAWPGGEPLAFFRGLIDDLDIELGDLLARRAALTAAVQQVKRALGTEPARDRRRAERAPALGEERLARIVHSVISESLDALEE